MRVFAAPHGRCFRWAQSGLMLGALGALVLRTDRSAWLALGLTSLLASFVAGVRELPRVEGAWWLALSGLAWLSTCAVALRAQLSRTWTFAGFAALRSAAWWAAPDSSPDVQRYAWEAEVWLAGHNPYLSAPDCAALEPLARELASLHAQVEHRSIAAIYPPLAQALFVLSTLAARAAAALDLAELSFARIAALRLLALTGDVAVLVVLERWLAKHSRKPGALVVWAWCPLVALEFAGAGHYDSIGIALALLALCGLTSDKPRTSAWLLAAAAAVKLAPGALAAFLAQGGARRRAWLTFALALALLLAPMAWAVAQAPTSSALVSYAGSWESTSALYAPLRAALEFAPASRVLGLEPKLVARAACALAGVFVLVDLARRRTPAPRAALLATAVFLLLSPTFHPWYAAWIVPWIALSAAGDGTPRAASVEGAFGALIALAPLQYVVLERWREVHSWQAPAWLWPLMFGPVLGLLIGSRMRPRAR